MNIDLKLTKVGYGYCWSWIKFGKGLMLEQQQIFMAISCIKFLAKINTRKQILGNVLIIYTTFSRSFLNFDLGNCHHKPMPYLLISDWLLYLMSERVTCITISPLCFSLSLYIYIYRVLNITFYYLCSLLFKKLKAWLTTDEDKLAVT